MNNIQLFCIYLFGCVIVMLIYNVIFYEKYNNKSYKDINTKDILKLSFILFSWLYIILLIIKTTNIFKRIMKTLKRIGKKLWEAYKDGVEMQYKYYYMK